MYDQNDLPEKVNKIGYLEYNYDNNAFYYSNNNNHKIFINFFDIKSVCNKYH